MAKMQSYNFQSIQDCIDFLPEEEQELLEFLREIIFDCIPDIKEKLAYNVPFYKVNKNICFLWPATIRWGNKPNSYKGIRFGFAQGYLLQDDISFLEKGDRKQVCYHDFADIKSVDRSLLEQFVLEALELDKR